MRTHMPNPQAYLRAVRMVLKALTIPTCQQQSTSIRVLFISTIFLSLKHTHTHTHIHTLSVCLSLSLKLFLSHNFFGFFPILSVLGYLHSIHQNTMVEIDNQNTRWRGRHVYEKSEVTRVFFHLNIQSIMRGIQLLFTKKIKQSFFIWVYKKDPFLILRRLVVEQICSIFSSWVCGF